METVRVRPEMEKVKPDTLAPLTDASVHIAEAMRALVYSAGKVTVVVLVVERGVVAQAV